jgi:prepilin-type processing-associated H-X9-DG protein
MRSGLNSSATMDELMTLFSRFVISDHRAARHIPRGVTVTEVLMVIAITGIMLSLVIPAVQNSRATARSIECRNRLKQIGLAVQSFGTAHRGVLPRPMNQFRDLLPYLDHKTLYDQLVAYREARLIESEANLPRNVRTFRENMATYAESPPFLGRVPELLCPADIHAKPERNHTNYRLNAGSVWRLPEHAPFQLPLLNGCLRGWNPWEPLSLAAIIDGQSNTVLYSERLVAVEPAARAVSWEERRRLSSSYPTRYIWQPAGDYQFGQERHLDEDCQDPANRSLAALFADDACAFRTHAGFYNHLGTPNRASCGMSSRSWDDKVFRTSVVATSEHSGGVHVLMADGSVNFASDAINRAIWTAVGTRNGAEAIVDF